MADQVQLRRGSSTTATRAAAYVGPIGEAVFDTDLKAIRMQDGVTPGGWIIPSSAGGNWRFVGFATVNSGAGATIAAANLVPANPGKLILTRTGPSADFTDVTDTAAAILALMAGAAIGASYQLMIYNGAAGLQTLTPGSGITLAGVVDGSGHFQIGPGSSRSFEIVVTALSPAAITIQG